MKIDEVYGVTICGLASDPEEKVCTRSELIKLLPWVRTMLVNPLELERLMVDYPNSYGIGARNPSKAPRMVLEADYFGTTYKITLLSVQVYYPGWHMSWTLSNAYLPEP